MIDSPSDNDTKDIYYISGYIVRELGKEIRQNHEQHSQRKPQFSAMLLYKSSGGLLKPCDEFFYLVREFENLVRKNVDHEKLHAKAIMKSELKEILLDVYQIPGNSGSSLVFQF